MDARDRQAIALIRQGQKELVEAILMLSERYGETLIAHCQVYLPSWEAEQSAEQTFEEFVRVNYQKYSLEDELDVLLLTIATRLSKERARAIGIEQFIDPNGLKPGDSLSQKDKEDRMLLRLRLDLKLSWAAIAKIMEIRSPEAAKQRGYRLVKLLEESKNVPRGT
jgi:hypothetical protein